MYVSKLFANVYYFKLHIKGSLIIPGKLDCTTYVPISCIRLNIL